MATYSEISDFTTSSRKTWALENSIRNYIQTPSQKFLIHWINSLSQKQVEVLIIKILCEYMMKVEFEQKKPSTSQLEKLFKLFSKTNKNLDSVLSDERLILRCVDTVSRPVERKAERTLENYKDIFKSVILPVYLRENYQDVYRIPELPLDMKGKVSEILTGRTFGMPGRTGRGRRSRVSKRKSRARK